MLRGQFLQGPEVRGRHREHPARRQRFEHRGAKGAPFLRVGAGSQFVGEDERRRRRLGEDLRDIAQVCAERRQRRRDRLLVAHVGENVVHEGNHRPRAHGRRHPRLQEGEGEPDGLEQHRLAAGIGTGEQQGALRCRERKVERDDDHPLGDEERMAPLDDPHRRARLVEVHGRRTDVEGKTCPGTERFELDQRLERCGHPRLEGAQPVARLAQNALALLDLVALELADAVAELHGGRRLDEQRGARPRAVVHDATHRATGLAAHGHHMAAIANGHRGVEHALVGGERRDDAFEQAHEICLGAAQLAADAAEQGRGVVLDFAFVADDAGDRLLLAGGTQERAREGREHGPRRERPAVVGERVGRAARRGQERRAREQLARRQRGPVEAEARQRGREVRHDVRRPACLVGAQGAHRGHPAMFGLDPRAIGARPERGDAGRAECRRGTLGDEREGAVEFEDRESVCVHAVGLTPLARAPRERWH